MLQTLILILLFAGALFYLGRMAWRSFKSQQSCSTGCGKCAEAHDRFSKVPVKP
ncbi:MAG: FeoB-associated Cys-rich membrane protein [Cyclobacteriaceae bacterium]|nr:FeoB-associated Cys-rich membrane protein [Cyclobacteriaceae bacterium]